jgi:ABC-type transport system substrate-binding protein
MRRPWPRSANGRRARARLGVFAVVSTLAIGVATPAGAVKQSSGILRYGVDFSAWSGSLDPAVSTSVCDAIGLDFIYDTLIHDDHGVPAPGLAQSWKLNGRTFTITLRRGLKFHDGAPFDAAAVKRGLEHNQQGNQTHDGLAIISSIDVVDDHTVRLNLNTDTGATLPYVLTGREGMIVAPSSLDKRDSNTKPVGAGPYTFDHYTPGGSLSVRRFKGYFDKHATQFGGIDFTQVTSGGPGVTALTAGDIDVLRPDAEQYDALKSQPGIGVQLSASLSYLQLQLNTTRGPLAKLQVRQAMNFAINRDELNRVVLGGRGVVAWMPWPETSPLYNAAVAKRYPFNPKKAKALLKQAGYPKGFDFVMVVPTGADFIDRQGQLLAQELGDVGIHVSISHRDSNEIVPTFYQAGDGDGFAALRVGDPSPTGDIYEQWGKGQQVAKYVVPGGGPDDITKLMLDAQASADPKRVVNDVRTAEKIIVDNALDLEVAFLPQLAAWNTSTISGKILAPSQPCAPVDLSRASLKS